MKETPKDNESPRVVRANPLKRQNGIAIRVIREKEGLSQNQLAKAAGIAQPSLSEIEGETVNAKLTTLNRIAHQLHIPVGAIVRGRYSEDTIVESEGAAEPEVVAA